jgi:activator of 2-hydroxyglutaryl-CoA dehydratase
MDKLLEQLAELKSIEITDEVKELSEKKIADMRQKTNEVVHTTNTGYGKELIPVNVLTDTVLEMVPMYAGILNAFMVGFH